MYTQYIHLPPLRQLHKYTHIHTVTHLNIHIRAVIPQSQQVHFHHCWQDDVINTFLCLLMRTPKLMKTMHIEHVMPPVQLLSNMWTELSLVPPKWLLSNMWCHLYSSSANHRAPLVFSHSSLLESVIQWFYNLLRKIFSPRSDNMQRSQGQWRAGHSQAEVGIQKCAHKAGIREAARQFCLILSLFPQTCPGNLK